MKRLLKFETGQRMTATGELDMEFCGQKPLGKIDLSEATDEEFDAIRANPYNDKLIRAVRTRIKKSFS